MSNTPYLRSGEVASRAGSRLLIVDVQEKFVPVIFEIDRVIANCRRLIQGAKILEVPVYATEQYPKGLGHLVPPLAELVDTPAQKDRFSCTEALAWGTAAGQSDGRHQIVVAGIEAHVCISQTVFDLLAEGFQVFVPADAISSRREFDWKIALDRLSGSGAIVTTTEAIMFEWCEKSGTPEFKKIDELVKT
jgi:isochorismate hydrolase